MTSIESDQPIELLNYPKALDAYRAGMDHPEGQIDPTSEQLQDLWHDYYDEANTKGIPGILGVMRILHGDKPKTLISVDLCDVVRTTCADFMDLGGFEVGSAGESYGYGIPYGIEDKPEIVTAIVRGIMIHDKVGPVVGIERIKEILQTSRNSGAFVLANTSTLAGCEPSTLRFMKKQLPDCFDGIVLPRNHDGMGKTTKGMAKIATLAELEVIEGDTKIRHLQHIDDAPHHIRGAREAALSAGITDFWDGTPEYPWNAGCVDLNIVPTPLEVFERSLEAFNERGK